MGALWKAGFFCQIFTSIFIYVAAADNTTDEITNFPDLLYESQVSVNNAGNAPKQQCDNEAPATPKPLICEPDPYDAICGSIHEKIRKQSLDRARALLEETLDVRKKYVEAKQRRAKEALLLLGPIPDRSSPGFAAYQKRFKQYYNTMYYDDKELINVDFGEKEKKLFAPTLEAGKEAFRIFYQTISQAPWPEKLREGLIEFFQSCDLNLIVGDDLLPNAFVTPSYDLEKTIFPQDSLSPAEKMAFETGEPVRIRPFSRISHDCNITMSHLILRECAQKNPLCFETLFHELSHFLNTCEFMSLISFSEDFSEKFPEAKASLGKMAKVSKIFLDLLKDPKISSRMAPNRSCLAALSDPKDAVLSRCQIDQLPFPMEFQRHCNSDHPRKIPNLTGYPAQWEEAEADFWGATMLAQWFKTNPSYKDMPSRQQGMTEIIATWCAYSHLDSERKTFDHFDPFFREVQEKVLSDPPKTFKELSTPKPGENDIENQFSCEDYPGPGERPAKKPWGSTHQSLKVRFNRNYLRNSDLREALGCVPRPDTPLTCSPYGRVKRPLNPIANELIPH